MECGNHFGRQRTHNTLNMSKARTFLSAAVAMAMAMSPAAQTQLNTEPTPIVANAPGESYVFKNERRRNNRLSNIGGSNRHSGEFRVLNQRQKRRDKRRFGYNRR